MAVLPPSSPPQSPIKGEYDDYYDDSDESEDLTVGMLGRELVSIEFARIKMRAKPKEGCIRIYGEISADIWADPLYLFHRSESDAVTLSSSDEFFDIPLDFPNFSLLSCDLPMFKICLYEKREERSRETLLVEQEYFMVLSVNKGEDSDEDDGSPLDDEGDEDDEGHEDDQIQYIELSGEGMDKFHTPITLDMMSNRAYFTLCFTRFEEACAVRLTFRLLRVDDSIFEGGVSGTINATQILFNQLSRTLTLFKSESPVAIASRASIPIFRPVLVAPLHPSGQVQFEWDLSINQSIPFKASVEFNLYPQSMPLESICLDQIAADYSLKMNIEVTPFYAPDAEDIQESLKDLVI